jgi:hypothetical protein
MIGYIYAWLASQVVCQILKTKKITDMLNLTKQFSLSLSLSLSLYIYIYIYIYIYLTDNGDYRKFFKGFIKTLEYVDIKKKKKKKKNFVV